MWGSHRRLHDVVVHVLLRNRFIAPALERFRVSAYLSGHDHNLQHLVARNVSYIVSGSGCQTEASKWIPEKTKFARYVPVVCGWVGVRACVRVCFRCVSVCVCVCVCVFELLWVIENETIAT
jgi:hypothetical protein